MQSPAKFLAEEEWNNKVVSGNQIRRRKQESLRRLVVSLDLPCYRFDTTLHPKLPKYPNRPKTKAQVDGKLTGRRIAEKEGLSVLKTVEPKGSGGSNPSPSAKQSNADKIRTRGVNKMASSKFSLNRKDEAMAELVRKTDQKTLAIWAIDCTERVLPYFEEAYPEDHRPRNAIVALQTWIDTGVFKMDVIRKASLDAHAAAREVGEDNAARSAARAAGQAAATAHVPTHSIGAAIYALQAIHRATDSSDAAVAKEREWQCHHLLGLGKTHESL